MFGNVAALQGLRVTGKYRNRSMRHTCSRHAAWDPLIFLALEVDIRLPGKGNSNSHGARPVYKTNLDDHVDSDQ